MEVVAERRTRLRLRAAVKVGGLCLAGILALIALVFLYTARLEAPRRAALREIAAAQETFIERRLARDGVRRYGTLEELTAAGLLRPGLGWCADTGPATDAPGERWWATADPSHPLTGRAFFTDQSGVIYSSRAPIRPRIDLATGKPTVGLQVVSSP